MKRTDGTSTSVRLKSNATFKGSWFQLARPMTWTGTLSPIIAGSLYAGQLRHFDFTGFILVMLAALFIQSSANMLNDYFDFRNGQDKERWTYIPDVKRRLRPVFQYIPYVAAVTCTIAIVLGIWLGNQYGWWVFVLGLIGILAAAFYSAGKKSLAAIGLGETVGAIFLGLVPFLLGFFIQDSSVTPVVFIAALPYILLISSMILTNNIRDIKKDEGFRRTVPMRTGRKAAVVLLRSLLIGAYAIVVVLAYFQELSWFVLVIFVAIPMGRKLWKAVSENANANKRLRSMKYAALHHWCFGLLYILGIGLGNFI